MKRYIYILLAGLFYSVHISCATGMPQNSRKAYMKNIYTDIYDLTKRLDLLMHQKAFEHNSSSLEHLDNQIRDIRYKRDIFMQHLRDIKLHGFSQIQQL